MSYQKTPTRTYTYRIPLDDERALRKLRILEKTHPDYFIYIVSADEIPNRNHAKNMSCIFFSSKERWDYGRDKIVGGPISGLEDYRYSLSWQEIPNVRGDFEMRNGSNGGTEIRGTSYVGHSDPRIPNRLQIEFTVDDTPSEIKESYNPFKEEFSEEIYWAEAEAIEKAEQKVQELVDNCEHKHVITTNQQYCEVAYCEDCGRGWNKPEFEQDQEASDVTIVGSV